MILLLVSSSLFAVALGFVVCLLHLPTTSSMVLRNVFGSDVNIEIDSDSFPSEAEIEEMDQSMPGCQHGYFKSTSHDNAKLHYRYWLPEGEVKGVAVFFHGINSHTGRGLIMDGRKLCTSLMSDMFLKQGICLYSLDMYGHGFSEGTRFLVKNWEYNKQDCIDFANFVSGQHPKSVPLFLAGESLGGCFAIHTAKHFQDDPGSSNLDSVLLSAPAVFADLPSFPTYQILRYILAPLIPKRKPFFMPHPISVSRYMCFLMSGCGSLSAATLLTHSLIHSYVFSAGPYLA
jgi:pimeloyl-ACP methyl ester carboxylesterase